MSKTTQKMVKTLIINFIVSNEEKQDSLNFIQDFDLSKFFPDAILIHRYDDSNIVHYGTECELNIRILYEYKNFYIVFKADTEGEECECDKWDLTYGSVKKGLKKCLSVIAKSDFDEDVYLQNVRDINSLMMYFKNMYGDDRQNRLFSFLNRYIALKRW